MYVMLFVFDVDNFVGGSGVCVLMLCCGCN